MPELILIMIVALIVIGPKKLPEMAKSMGRGYREFQKAISGVKEEVTNLETSVTNEFDSTHDPNAAKDDKDKDQSE